MSYRQFHFTFPAKLTVAASFGVVAPLIAAAQLSYVERSAGLGTPDMEGGNTEIEYADVDADGFPDLVSIGDHGSPFIGTNQHGIMVWLSQNAQSWSVQQAGDFGYGGVALGDLNGDGLMDAAYAMHHNYSSDDFGDQLIEAALGDGSGAAWTPWDDGLATQGEDYGMFATDLADVDNDGDLDLGSVSFGCCNGLRVYLNNGDGTWTFTFGVYGGNSQSLFEFGDVNGDGNADVAAALGSGNSTVYLGDGAGGFAPADTNLPPGGNIGRPGISLGDVTGDGRDELAFVTTAGGVAVWQRLDTSSWQNLSGSLPAAGSFARVEIADMDCDGFGDLVAYSYGATARVQVYVGDGVGGWTLAASIRPPINCDLAALRAGVDVDHNGLPDLAVIGEENCGVGGGANRLRQFVEASTPAQESVHPLAPLGGETWVAGSVRFVDWTSAVLDTASGAGAMTLELSTHGAGGPWSPIVAGAPNSGRYQWLMPAGLPGGSDCRIRFTLSTGAGQTVAVSNAFTIAGGGPAGDLDGDGDVDLADLSRLLVAFGACSGDPAYDATADLDGSGCVDLADLSMLLANFGS